MGLGKTIQAIAVAYYYRAEWPLLVVLPSSMKYPWIEELEKWLPCLQPRDINLINSSTDISNISKSAISLIGYGLMRGSYKTLREALHKQEFKIIILDESHFMKNPKAARTKTLVPLLTKAKRVLMLSGTPALARPSELYPQINCLAPGEFGSWTSFAKKFCDAKMKFFGRMRKWDTTGASNLPELHKKLTATVMIRREKREVLKELPPKRRQKVPFELAESPQKKGLEKLWADLGLYMKGEFPADCEGNDAGFEIRKLAMELYVATGKAKIGAICEYIKMLLDNPEMKFLVFAHHKELLTAVVQTVQAYAREKEPSLKYIRIDGDVPPIERMKDVNRFQQDPDVRVAALSIMAAGTGLTLTAASHVVFAELHWTPGVLEQCEDRAHRIGQLNAIHIHYLVARGTIDEWMWSALNRKVGVLSSTLNGRLQQLDAEVLQGGISDFLKQAAVWLPSNLEDEEDEECLFSQTQKESKDIRSFMQPSQSRRKTLMLEDRFLDEPSPVISLVDSDESEADDTTDKNMSTKRRDGGEIDSFSDPESETEVTVSEIIADEDPATSGNMTGTGCNLKDASPRTSNTHSSIGKEQAATGGELLSQNKTRARSVPSAIKRTKDDPSLHLDKSSAGSCSKRAITGQKPGALDQDMASLVIPMVPAHAGSSSVEGACSLSTAKGGRRYSSDGSKARIHEPNSNEVHVSDSSDSDTELIVGRPFSSQKVRRSQPSSSNAGAESSQGTPSSSLDRRRDCIMNDVCVTPDGSNNRGKNKEQWNCPACTFLNHESLPLCEICDTPRRRAAKQRRATTRSRIAEKPSERNNNQSVAEEPSKKIDDQSITETFSESDDDFEIRPRVVRMTPSGKKCARQIVSGKQGGKIVNNETPTGARRDECRKTGRYGRSKGIFPTSIGKVAVDDTERLRGGNHEADANKSVEDSSTVIQSGAQPLNEHGDMAQDDSSHIHGIDISDSDGVDSFLKVDVLGTDSGGVGTFIQDQEDCLSLSSKVADGKPGFSRSITVGNENEPQGHSSLCNMSTRGANISAKIAVLPQNDGSSELSDALFSDEDDSEIQNDRPPKDMDISPSQIIKEVHGAVESLLRSPHHGSGSEVKPWTCLEPSCEFVNTSSQIECENCWAPNPDDAKDAHSLEVSAKVHNLGLRQSPGFISASRLLAEQGGHGNIEKMQSVDSSPNQDRPADHNPSTSEKQQTKGANGSGTNERDVAPQPKTYEAFLYCASKFTERIYLYDMEEKPLDCAFQPLDLRARDVDNLPAVLHVPANMRVTRIFLREWDSLTDMKKRKLRKSGLIFDSPVAAVDALMKKRPFELSKQRFLTKDDLANAALRKAEEVGGSIRVIHRTNANQTLKSPSRAANLQFVKSPVSSRKRKDMSEESTGEGGSSDGQEPSKKMKHCDDVDDDDNDFTALTAKSSFVQAVNADGVPLCVFCSSPVEVGDLSNRNAAWDTRYCSEMCKLENQVRWRNSKYVREQLLEVEHGICQLCQLDAHGIYRNIRDAPKSKRKEFLSKTAYSSLSSRHLNDMIKTPSEGQFWHADHIIPVYKGGGLCSMENFRTLCVLCHTKVTADQYQERKETRRLEANKKAGLRDIRKFFQDKG